MHDAAAMMLKADTQIQIPRPQAGCGLRFAACMPGSRPAACR